MHKNARARNALKALVRHPQAAPQFESAQAVELNAEQCRRDQLAKIYPQNLPHDCEYRPPAADTSICTDVKQEPPQADSANTAASVIFCSAASSG